MTHQAVHSRGTSQDFPLTRVGRQRRINVLCLIVGSRNRARAICARLGPRSLPAGTKSHWH
eukprot:9197819-Karenia_brevis.AAC.1